MNPERPHRELHLLSFPWRRRSMEAQTINAVPDWVFPTMCQEIQLDTDPIAVARAEGIESDNLQKLCRRSWLRVASTALPRSAAESLRRMWDALEKIDSPAIRPLAQQHGREDYFRDETAWQAVFYDHVRRQL